MAFVAAFLLFCRDSMEHRAAVQTVRNYFDLQHETSDEEFLAARPYQDTGLLLEVRLAILRFFGVPSTKIDRNADLVNDLRVNRFEPGFQFSVVSPIVSSRVTNPRMYAFTMSGLQSIDDLADAIAKVLDDLNRT
jgi:hypothetical protein